MEDKSSMSIAHPELSIPLAERKFKMPPKNKPLLVIQYVTEIGTERSYFRFMGPNKVEGHAGTAEEAYERVQEIADRLGYEIHSEIVPITI